MDPIQLAALERIGTAIEGRSLQGYTEVLAGDVVALGLAVKGKEPSPRILELVAGAAKNAESQAIWQKTELLAGLVELAKG